MVIVSFLVVSSICRASGYGTDPITAIIGGSIHATKALIQALSVPGTTLEIYRLRFVDLAFSDVTEASSTARLVGHACGVGLIALVWLCLLNAYMKALLLFASFVEGFVHGFTQRRRSSESDGQENLSP